MEKLTPLQGLFMLTAKLESLQLIYPMGLNGNLKTINGSVARVIGSDPYPLSISCKDRIDETHANLALIFVLTN
jgi:hypothetical protein